MKELIETLMVLAWKLFLGAGYTILKPLELMLGVITTLLKKQLDK